MAKEKNIILGVSASIAIYKSCDIIRQIQKKFGSVTVVMTKESEELIRPIVFQSLSGNKVYSGLFDSAGTWEIEHISLAKKADLILLAPATANIIAKLAAGICDDLLTCVILATKAPVLIAPAMNENMYSNKVTQDNISKLKKLGYVFIGPQEGKLACGEIGAGCLADIGTIIKKVESSF